MPFLLPLPSAPGSPAGGKPGPQRGPQKKQGVGVQERGLVFVWGHTSAGLWLWAGRCLPPPPPPPPYLPGGSVPLSPRGHISSEQSTGAPHESPRSARSLLMSLGGCDGPGLLPAAPVAPTHPKIQTARLPPAAAFSGWKLQRRILLKALAQYLPVNALYLHHDFPST